MNLPNILTCLRLLITLIFVYIFYTNIFAAAILFVLAVVTDYLDGHLARKYDMVTSFGKIMDPIADKFLILSAFAMFASLKIVFWWMFWAIAVREIAVTVFRFWAMSKGKVLAAEKAGKVKTVIQMVTLILLFISVIFYPQVFTGKVCPRTASVYVITLIAVDIILLFLTVIITALSGVSVFWSNRSLLLLRKEPRHE